MTGFAYPRELVDVTPLDAAAARYDDVVRSIRVRNAPSQTHAFHYTSIANLSKIFESGVMFCTDYAFLNDRTEVSLGLETIDGVIAKLGGTVGMTPDRLSSVRQHIAWLRQGGHHLTVYCASWSAMADDLSQWRAYAPQEGVSIGFPLAALERAALLQDFVFGKVAYIGTNGFEEWMVDRVRELNRGLESAARVEAELNAQDPSDVERLAHMTQQSHHLDRFLATVAGLAKSAEFRHEQELRCIWTRLDNSIFRHLPIKHRPVGRAAAPYVEFSFDPAAVDKVIIGPNSNPENARLARDILIRAGGAAAGKSVETPDHGFRL